MTNTNTEEQTDYSIENARGWYQSILDMLERFGEAEAGELECDQCEGTGIIAGGLSGDQDDDECPVCAGTGMIVSELNEEDVREEDVREEIQESVLSVSVRSGWHSPGAPEDAEPAEYEVLLTTGGPALRITGDIGLYGQPDTAHLQVQDWFKPWSSVYVADDQHEVLLRFVSHFWFGE